MRLFVILFLLFVRMVAVPAQAQDDPKSLSPSEAYKAAMSPLNAARAQQNDLTEADKYALGVGIGMASRDCLALAGYIRTHE